MGPSLENIQAVQARIEEIKRRFEEPGANLNRALRSQRGWSAFDAVLHRAQSGRHAPCPKEFEPLIADASRKYGIAPEIIKAVIRAESGFRPDAVSRAGAQGLMQLMPGTARGLGVDPSDPSQNIDGGTRYLKQQLDRFGDLELALAAYNAGPGSVTRYGGIPPYAETQNYVRSVLDNISLYK